MRCERRGNRGQETWGLITGRLPHLALELRQGRCHAGMPAGVIAGLSQLFQHHAVAFRVPRHQAKAARTRCVRRHRAGFAGHGLGHACGGVVAVGDQRFFNPVVDRLLSALGGRHKAVKPRQVEEETPQAHAARPDFDAAQREGQHQPVEKGQPGATLKALGHIGTDIKGGMP